MRISTKLKWNATLLLAINAAIVAAGLMGIDGMRQRAADLTERSTPYQTRSLELQRAIQGLTEALNEAPAAGTQTELDAAKAKAGKALADVTAAEKSLGALGFYGLSGKPPREVGTFAEGIFPALEAGLTARTEATEAGRQTMGRLAEASRLLKELLEKMREQSANCFADAATLAQMGGQMEARAQRLFAAGDASEAGRAAQGLREGFSEIDTVFADLNAQLKKLDAPDNVRFSLWTQGTIYGIRQALLAERGGYAKVAASFEAKQKAEEASRRIHEAVARYAEESRARVASAHGDERKTMGELTELGRKTTRGLIVLGACAAGLGLAFSVALGIGIARPLRDFGVLTEQFGEGDLTVQMNQSRRDEFGGVAKQFNKAVKKINRTIRELSGSSAKLAKSAAELLRTAGSVQEDAASISAQMGKTAENAGKTNDKIKATHSMAAKAMDAMVELNTTIQAMAEHSHSAQGIVKSIHEISFKTNLLALNAAVEAARAGQAGAGFEIVAQEVRNLAGQTAEAARETADRIGKIVAGTTQGKESAKSTGSAFERVSALTAEVDAFIEAMAKTSKEQEARVRKISSRAMEMGRIAQENAAAAKQLSGSIQGFRLTRKA